jgi:SecD/SecF fusion protein
VIVVYLTIRFEYKLALPALLTVVHDLWLSIAVYSVTGREVTSATVAALLTILGYSLYDVVIVFDRIRENAPRMPRAAFSQIVNRSMSDVLTRSLATSMCTVMGVTSILLFGGDTLKDFAFALLVGIASGTYSSIFIAAPVLTEWKEREATFRQRRRRIVEEYGFVPPYPVAARGAEPVEAGGPAERPAKRRRKPAPIASAAPDGQDEIPEELALEHAEDGHEVDLEKEAAPVGSPSQADRSAQLRAERAERKKQRAARQSRKARKHGRSR